MAFEQDVRRRIPDEEDDSFPVLDPDEDGQDGRLVRFSPASVTIAGPGPPPTPVGNPNFTPDYVHMDRDHTVPSRTRRHQEETALRFNSLSRLGQLVKTNTNVWELGYQTTDAQAWNPTPGAPILIQEALDRIAALLKELNGGIGP